MKNKIDQYFSLEREIFEFFGFNPEWQQYPLTDARDMYWLLNGSEELCYYEEEMTEEHLNDSAYYSAEIRNKKIYRKDGLVLVVGDTLCDNNIYSFILDESKEQKND